MGKITQPARPFRSGTGRKNYREFFSGRTLALGTKHKKEKVIAPILERELGVRIIVPDNFDTDQFGTFTREIARTGDQLEAARRKATAAMDLVGADLGLASEGSFGPHPGMPFITSNFELVLLIDRKYGLEIRGHHRSGKTNALATYVSSVAEAKEFAKEIGFPQHGLVVRRSEHSKRDIFKGITSYQELEEKVSYLLGKFFVKKVYLETDLRAHVNPTRMKSIELATKDLVENIKSLCPKCAIPGFVMVDVVRGLPCGGCGQKTDLPLAIVRACQKCGFKIEGRPPESKEFADPGMCGYCNP